jgi:hypothetical protein
MKNQIALIQEKRVFPKSEIRKVLEPGELGLSVEYLVKNKNNDITFQKGPLRSESFVQAFLQLLYVRMQMTYKTSPIVIKDISNTNRDVFRYFANGATGNVLMRVVAGAATVNTGIIIGTGSTAPTISDYKIETIIPHATMNYSAQTYGSPAADATTSQWTITRNFTNVSGGDVTVEEVALYAQGWYASAIGYFCIIRDVTGGIVVPNGDTLTVNYRMQAVV